MLVRRLDVSFIGKLGSNPALHPSEVFGDDLSHTICLLLAESPRSSRELESASGSSRSRVSEVLRRLLTLRAIRDEAGRFRLDFSLLTREDLLIIRQQAVPLSRALGERVRAEAGAIEAGLSDLLTADQPGSRAQLAFAVAGCFGLDWRGIGTLHEQGYLGIGRRYPDGGEYVLVAEESGTPIVPKEYCASRTVAGVHYAFTSFGDSGPRFCLPDLITRSDDWTFAEPEWPPDIRSAIRRIRALGAEVACDTLGALVAGNSTIEDPDVLLLREAGYLLDGRAQVPVLRRDDLPAIREVVEAVARAVTAWAAAEVPRLGEALALLTPVRHGVSPQDLLNHVWHFIFGGAVRLLAESGFMLDPEPGPAGRGRHLSWVAEADLCRDVWRLCVPGAAG